MIILLCGTPLFFSSCQKEDLTGSQQIIELYYYAYDGSTTPVEVTWSMQPNLRGEKIFTETESVKFSASSGYVLNLTITPDSINRFLNSYFRVLVNDVTVRSVKLYNDADKNTENIHLIYYDRNLQEYHVQFLHNTNDDNTTSPYQLTWYLNDSACGCSQSKSLTATTGDRVSFQLNFKIQPNDENPVFHETLMKINGEIVRYDYVKRKKCGTHTCEMTTVLEPYL